MTAAETAAQSDWHDGFLFLGNHLALDFLNTRPVINEKPTELLPDWDALLRWMQAAGLLTSREAAALLRRWKNTVQAQQTVQALRRLREKLRRQILAWEDGKPVRPALANELNRLMAQHPMQTRLSPTGPHPKTQLYFETSRPSDLIAPIAHSAATLFADVDQKSVRKCDQCVLHFHDISKKGQRRWCSMQLCGNRHKVAAYAARQRHSQKNS